MALATVTMIASFAKADEGYRPLSLKNGVVTTQAYVSNGGAGRCKTEDCICKVNVAAEKNVPTNVLATSRRVSVYFNKDSSFVDKGSKETLKNFTSKHPGKALTAIGYTDGCGDLDHNSKLAEKRVTAVSKVLNNSNIDTVLFKPEITDRCDASSRRVDLIAHTKSRVTTMMDKIPADVYLIDASGSMWESWRNWSDVVSASFKPGSRIYLSKTVDCENGQQLSKIKPGGGTEIWYSYWKVLDFMNEGETLVVISDFISDIPLTQRESDTIENKVASKNIKVIALQL